MRGIAIIAAALSCSACVGPATARIGQDWNDGGYDDRADLGTGMASYFASEMAGRRTASGERCDPGTLTAAHRTAPFGSRILVTNLDNGRRVVVRVNDRGPFRASRVIDLSRAAAAEIAMIGPGTARVKLTLLDD